MNKGFKPRNRQYALARELVENVKRKTPLNKKQLVARVGYSQISAQKKSGTIIESQGVKMAIRSLGLTEDFITKALMEDIELKPQARLGELRLASDILGMTQNVEQGNKTLVINISGETAERYKVANNKDEISK